MDTIKPKYVPISTPVSYTHLDVYKRQGWGRRNSFDGPDGYVWVYQQGIYRWRL